MTKWTKPNALDFQTVDLISCKDFDFYFYTLNENDIKFRPIKPLLPNIIHLRNQMFLPTRYKNMVWTAYVIYFILSARLSWRERLGLLHGYTFVTLSPSVINLSNLKSCKGTELGIWPLAICYVAIVYLVRIRVRVRAKAFWLWAMGFFDMG